PAKLAPGTYRNVSGNTALAYGLVAASQLSGLPLFLGAYPITPASDILHELSKHKAFGIRTFQAEDEIAGVGAALGAAFGGSLGVTTSSGPGIALKAETIGLAVSLELPLLVIDIQRSGPSTGMPTKTEKADGTGNISYDPENHDRMVHLRAAKVARIAADIAPLEVDHQDGSRLLVLGWGSTYGPIGAAVRRVRASGARVSVAHLRHLNP